MLRKNYFETHVGLLFEKKSRYKLEQILFYICNTVKIESNLKHVECTLVYCTVTALLGVHGILRVAIAGIRATFSKNNFSKTVGTGISATSTTQSSSPQHPRRKIGNRRPLLNRPRFLGIGSKLRYPRGRDKWSRLGSWFSSYKCWRTVAFLIDQSRWLLRTPSRSLDSKPARADKIGSMHQKWLETCPFFCACLEVYSEGRGENKTPMTEAQ